MNKCIVLFLLLITSNLLYADEGVSSEKNTVIKQITSLWKEKRANTYQSLTINEMQRAEDVFKKLLRNDISSEVRAQLSALNLSLLQTKGLLIISEINKPYLGLGMFVINPYSQSEDMLQAPHAYHDFKTGKISIKLFVENKLKALAINTVKRFYFSKNGSKISADMANLKTSLFVAFSRAYVSEYMRGRIIQLHGFNANKRSSTRAVDFILSSGTKAYSQKLIMQKNCIRHNVSTQSYIYPLDIRVLGGTKNSIGNSVREMGFSGFEHIEVSLPLRKKLNRSIKSRYQLSRCLLL